MHTYQESNKQIAYVKWYQICDCVQDPPRPPHPPGPPPPPPPNKKQYYKTEKCSSEDNKPSIRLLELLVDKFSINFWRGEKLSIVGCSESSPVILDRRGLFRKPFWDEPAKSEIGNQSFEWNG
jgi:hypothetical protein